MDSNMYLLGIDNGGSSAKVVLFDTAGHEIASAKRNTPLYMPAPGHTERDMDELYRINCEVIREVIQKAGVDASSILGISFSGHGKGLYLWGVDERPVRPGIVSTDSRAYDYIERWNADGTSAKAFEKTCQSILACQSVALISWLRDNEPGAIENTKWVFGVKDYLRYRMTGEAHGEITDMSGSSLVNLKTASYDDELLALYGLSDIRAKLPPLVYSSEFCGKVTAECAELSGLIEGTPVAAGLFDIDACAIGMNVVDDSRLCVIAGTWSINEYISKTPVLDRSVKMNSLYCLPGYYLVEECSPTSASNLDWFLSEFLKEAAQGAGENIYDYANALAGQVAPMDQDILFLPYLYGGADDARAKSAFVGLLGHHTRAHMLRAVFESIVFGHRLHIERLLKSREQPPEAVRIAGGVVNSELWVQMFADVLQLPVETITVSELGTLGAAMTAAVAAGVYEDLEHAAKGMATIGRVYMPNAENAQIYQRKYEKYCAVEQALSALWGKL